MHSDLLITGSMVHYCACVFCARRDHSPDHDHSDDGGPHVTAQRQLLHQGYRCVLGNLLQLHLRSAH